MFPFQVYWVYLCIWRKFTKFSFQWALIAGGRWKELCLNQPPRTESRHVLLKWALADLWCLQGLTSCSPALTQTTDGVDTEKASAISLSSYFLITYKHMRVFNMREHQSYVLHVLSQGIWKISVPFVTCCELRVAWRTLACRDFI